MKNIIFATIFAGMLVAPAMQAAVVKAPNARGVQVTSTPEPASMLLLGSGLFAIGAFKARKGLKVRSEKKN